jgi:hypothetical protein
MIYTPSAEPAEHISAPEGKVATFTQGDTLVMASRKLYQIMASLIQARINCRASGNREWFERHTDRLEHLAKCYLPSGGGFDNGSKLDLSESTPERIVLSAPYHHMNDGGMYDGWSEHTVIVTPSLASGFNLRITGRDRNAIKAYIAECFYDALTVRLTIHSTIAGRK